MSQAVYWQPRATNPDGWWWKTREQWAAETHLTRSEQETARKTWRRLGVLQERRSGVPARIHYLVDLERLAQLIRQLAGFDQLDGDSDPTRRAGLPGQMAGNRPTLNPETTSENSSETTSVSRARSARKRTPAIAGGDNENVEADPVLSGIVGSVVEAIRHGPAIRDLRAVIVSAIRERHLPVSSRQIDAILVAVQTRVAPRS